MCRLVSVVAIVVLLCGVGACGPTRSVEPAAPSSSSSAGETAKPRKVVEPHADERQSPPVEEEEPQPAEPDYEALARRVVAGKFGNGDARRVALGADYERVQGIVDSMMSSQSAPVQSAPRYSLCSSPPLPRLSRLRVSRLRLRSRSNRLTRQTT